MNKKNVFVKIVVSVVCVIGLIICAIAIGKQFVPSYDGKITINLVDSTGEVIDEKVIKFNSGDTLEYLLKENYDHIVLGTDSLSGMLLEIDELKTDMESNIWILYELNGQDPGVGMFVVEFKDGDVFTIKEVDFGW